jgi:ribosome biogenesis protein MAK21
MTEGRLKMNRSVNGKSSSQTHRRGKSTDGRPSGGEGGGRGRGGGGTTPYPSTTSATPLGNNWKVPSFHAPLIQWSEDASTWFSYGENLPGRNDVLLTPSNSSATYDQRQATKLMTPELIRRYRSIADSIIQTELRLYSANHSNKSSSDEKWVENTMKKGTLKDRIAAMSVTVSGDPIHKFYALDGLMGMVGCSTQSSAAGGGNHSGGKPNSRVAQLTAEALDDLFMNTLLPSDRKLVTLAQRPLYKYENFDDDTTTSTNNKMSDTDTKKKSKKNNSGSTVKTLSPRILLLWRFEEMIKDKYDLYLRQYMAQTLQDGAEQQKTTILQSAARLLSSNPEGESKLLSMMVNKLGDPEKKTAAASGHQLRVVLQRHPAMQDVVAREVQQLAHRPHLSPKALYNCIAFLNQLHLKRPDNIVPIQKKNGDDDDDTKQQHPSTTVPSLPASLIKTYFRLFEVAVQKNNSQHRDKSPSSSSSSDEAGTMKSRLLSALLTGVNRAHPYLPEGDRDMREHVDALFRIVHTAPPAACTQALMLLFHLAVGSQVDKDKEDTGSGGEGRLDSKSDKPSEGRPIGNERKQQQDRFYRALYATLSKGNIVSGGKHQTLYYNLLYKAMKYDTDMTRVHVFAKRLLAAVMHAPPASIAASLFLLQEISKTHQGLRDSWEDVPDPESNAWIVLDDSKREPKAGLVCRLEDEEGQNKDISVAGDGPGPTPPGWEIALLTFHVHPSVAKFAQDIGDIEYPGDPLQDFALAPLLDKFAYRNPKSLDKVSRQRAGRAATTPYRRMGKLQARLQLPVNDPSFLERTTVNEQEEFFHRFFVERARRDEIKGIARRPDVAVEGTKTKRKPDDDDDEDGFDEAEQKAFDDAEKNDGFVGSSGKFEEYEAMWETDDEEEAFVDSLAVQLLEDAAGEPADIDDDPEGMDDWGDIHADDDDDDDDDVDGEVRDDDQDVDGSDDESSNDDGEKIVKSTRRTKRNTDDDNDDDDDADAFMESEGLNEDSDYDDSDMEPDLDEKDIIRRMTGKKSVQQGQDQEDNDDDGQEENQMDDDDDDHDEDDDDDALRMVLINGDSDDDDDDDSDEDEDEDHMPGRKTKMHKATKKSKKDLPTFAPADEYEEVIHKSFHGLKRGAPTSMEEDEEVENDSSPKKTQRIEQREGSSTKRNRRKQKS